MTPDDLAAIKARADIPALIARVEELERKNTILGTERVRLEKLAENATAALEAAQATIKRVEAAHFDAGYTEFDAPDYRYWQAIGRALSTPEPPQ